MFDIYLVFRGEEGSFIMRIQKPYHNKYAAARWYSSRSSQAWKVLKCTGNFNCSSFIADFIDYEMEVDLEEITRHWSVQMHSLLLVEMTKTVETTVTSTTTTTMVLAATATATTIQSLLVRFVFALLITPAFAGAVTSAHFSQELWQYNSIDFRRNSEIRT